MKSLKILLALLTVSLGAASVMVNAAPAGHKDGPATTQSATTKAATLLGEITKINTTSINLTLKPKNKGAQPEEKTLTLADNCEITIDKEKKALGDLKVGEKAKVTLDAPDGKAVKIAVTTKAANKPPAKPQTKPKSP